MLRRLPSLLVVLVACSSKPHEQPHEREAEPERSDAGGSAGRSDLDLRFNRDASDFDEALASIDREIAAARARATEHPSWTTLEKITGLQLGRARLSGSYDDYAAAQATLAEAFQLAPQGTGPVLTRAALDFTLHRLDAIENDLAAYERMPIIDEATRARIAAMRGDVAFERGQYQAAREHYDAALALQKTSSLQAKLAQWHWRMGEFDEAERLYGEALAAMPDKALEARAWVNLQLGLMDLERGRLDQAFAHYRDGAEILGGWWLLEEHIAEIASLQGLDAFALELYTDIIARTGKPEFIDAKAELLARAGDSSGAAAAIAEAGKRYEAELLRFPEASSGHALEHFLEFGPPARALELAEANHRVRPGVPAKISLAQARLQVDDVAGARQIIDEALASKWVSAELDWVAAQVYERLGEAERAASLRASAEALHPGITRE